MRRLWSYIVLTGASLVLMGSTFASVFKQSTSNIEYSEGRELVFRLEDKEGNALKEEDVTEDEVPSEIIAKSMIERLDTLKVTNYEVATVSFDTVKVTLKQDTDANYNNVQNLMTFNGSLALSSRVDEELVLDNSREDEKFVTGDAYMETVNDYPSINIPVGGRFKDLYEVVKKFKEDNKTEAAESQTSGEGEEAETTYTYCMYLWHDYNADDKFSQTISGNENYDPKVAQKVFMSFDIAELQSLEDEGKSIEKLTAYVNIKDVNGNSKYEASEVRSAFDTARYYVALINSGALDYGVKFMYSENVSASTELLVSVDGIVQWSATLRATIVCVVILSLLLAVFFRLGALGVATTSIASVYAGVASIILFTAEFNAAGLIGLVAVAIASIASGVIYLTKVKEEAYRGRSLKKANSEAAKKSLLPILDINVVLVILGIFAYVFGGALMRSFAIITVLGGLVSLILNLLALRGLMWLATNTTKLQGKYEYFGIDSKHVPNLLKEEKQTYYGSYAEKDFTKKKKPVGIIAAVLLVAGITGMIVFGVIGNTDKYKSQNRQAEYTEIFVESDIDNTPVKEPKVRAVLSNIYVYESDESKAESLEKRISDVYYHETEETKKVEGASETITHTYCVVRLNGVFDEDKYNSYYVELDDQGQEIGSRIYSTDFGGISGLIVEKVDDADAKVSFKEVSTVSTEQPEFYPIIWGTLVGLAVSAVYLLIRYRLSRGLATLIVPTGLTAVVAGALAFTRLGHAAMVNYAIVTLPVVAFFALLVGIFWMNREREMVIEDKNHDNSVENRNEIMVKSTSIAFSSILLIAILAIYIAINFFGFGATGNAWMFLVLVASILVIVLFETILYGPISQFFYKLFSKVNIDKFTNLFKRKKKKKVVNTPRSAEPEERTFIGIND